MHEPIETEVHEDEEIDDLYDFKLRYIDVLRIGSDRRLDT
jgi:hypothetical protein